MMAATLSLSQVLVISICPRMLLTCGHQFYQCRLSLQPSEGVSPVPYFLACRAIELKVKSIHLEQNNQEAVKETFGHNLLKTYEALPQALQTLSNTELDLLRKANAVYRKK